MGEERQGADPVRRAEARRRLVLALEQPTDKNLSDVIYDAAHDGTDWPDGEGGVVTGEYGYDCDDLAAVLWPFLQALRHSDGDDGA